MPQLLGDHYYGSGVLLPDGPERLEQGDGDRRRPAGGHRGDRRGEPRRRLELPGAAARGAPQRQQRAHRRRGDHHDRRQRHRQLTRSPGTTRCATTRPPTPGRSSPPRLEQRGYHSTALLLPDGRIVSAGDDGPTGGGGAVRRDRGLLAALPVQGRRGRAIMSAPDEVGYGAGFSVTTSGEPVDHAVLMAPGRHDARQRHAPAPGAAGHDLRRRGPHRADQPGHPRHRPAGLLRARAGERRGRALRGPLPAPRR